MTRFRPSCNGRVPAATNVDGKFEQGHPITHVKLLPCFSWDLHCWKGISFDFSFNTETEHSRYLLHQSPYNYFIREYLQCILSLWIIIHYLAAKQSAKSALLHTPAKKIGNQPDVHHPSQANLANILRSANVLQIRNQVLPRRPVEYDLPYPQWKARCISEDKWWWWWRWWW